MIARSITLFVLFVCLSLVSSATHNRAGELTYRHLSGYTYEVTITTYTKTSVVADRPELYIFWGDGSKSDTLNRDGFSIIFFPEKDAQKNVYKGSHTFPGPGRFTISIEDPNRNNNIENLKPPGGQSDQVVFYVQSELIINPFAPVGTSIFNNSVILLNAPLDNACFRKRYEHNPGAYDPDGDSLSYKLVACRGEGGVVLPYYIFPDQIQPGPANTISIDPVNGDLVWDAAQKPGLYNVAILIEEWRNGQKVGSVMRDMQIEVLSCANIPPLIAALPDTCIEVGTVLNFPVTASDPNSFQTVELSASGLPFNLLNTPATFTAPSPSNPITAQFTWNTSCENVKRVPYQVFFRAEDNGKTQSGGNEPSLVDLENAFIRIVAPAPKNITTTPGQNNISISWSPSICNNAIGYKLYRRAGTSDFVPDYCQTGLPPSAGYTLIATINGVNNSIYLDNDVSFSPEYCYRVLAFFADGAESYISEEVCSIVKRDIPVLTGASVGSTAIATGRDSVIWALPTELDTLTIFTGPYEYRVYRKLGINAADELVYTTPASNSLSATDTILVDLNLNTQDSPFTYRVELYNNGQKVGSSSNGSTIFLSAQPNDRILKLSWEVAVPWGNTYYAIYRLNTQTNQYDSIGFSKTTQFNDSNLVNGQSYCYYVKSVGQYINPSIRRPLVNYSQSICAIPVDKTAPCLPLVNVTPYCNEERAYLNWLDTNVFCTADLKQYNVYYANTSNGELSLLESLPRNASEFSYLNQSIAGCYAISVTDSVGNESVRSQKICIDNCPFYTLPDVFTPNNDNVNDLFTPFPYRYVTSIDIKIYNRWGKLLFETTNPDINWDGKANGKLVPDGVYFYAITINKNTLNGLVPEYRSGSVTIFKDSSNKNP